MEVLSWSFEERKKNLTGRKERIENWEEMGGKRRPLRERSRYTVNE